MRGVKTVRGLECLEMQESLLIKKVIWRTAHEDG
jgi:hypothetical protein